MTRRRRALAAVAAAFALFFAQMAVSAHACFPHEQPASAGSPAHPAGCGGATVPVPSTDSDNLCAEHCHYGSASFDNESVAPAVADATGPVLRVESPAEAPAARERLAWRVAPVAAPPPPAILFGVLRI